MERVIVAPSILAADFSRLADEINRVEAAGADWIHCDIMDGHFVDNILRLGRRLSGLRPNESSARCSSHDRACRSLRAALLVKAGANSITVHGEPEAKHDVEKTLQQIRDTGCRAGLTLNPETPFDLIEPFLHKIDLLLIMTVHPGFGGQSFRADQMHKVKRARSLNPDLDLEVDGGINADTAKLSIENGANVLVAGTSIFHSKDYAKAIRELRGDFGKPQRRKR
jgi:ribulose-phosphate 3-epimerase